MLATEREMRQVWLHRSRAMGHQRHGSAIDLTLVGEGLSGDAPRRLMQAVRQPASLLLPWSVDLSLHVQLDAALDAQVRAPVPVEWVARW